MPDFDWQPIRDRWAELAQVVVDPQVGRRDNRFRIKRWLNPFAGPDLGIALTGMRGTGKTTLHRALRHRLQVGEYADRGESPDRETDQFLVTGKNGKKRVQLVVVPGQKDSDQGKRTINQFFRDGKSPTGVVHSVSWGYSTIWDHANERAALDVVPTASGAAGPSPNPIARIREFNLTHELADFQQTRELLQDAWRYTTKPVWLILAISKVDLYRNPADLANAANYYIPAANPSNDTDFSRELRGLVDHTGQGRMAGRVTVVPACSYLEQFSTTTNTQVTSSGDLDLTSVLLANVLHTIGEFCVVEPR